MTRPRLRSPDQPLLVQLLFGLHEFCASLKLAVVLIAACAVTLAWATFVERDYGDKSRAVNYGIYETWWFAAITVLLGLNVLCAALIRFPWKKSQTGFVFTHAGILLLLFGAFLTRCGGIDANLPVFEGQAQWRAFEDSQHFKLSIYPQPSADPSGADASPALAPGPTAGSEAGRHPQTVLVPFVAGPFNWEDFGRMCWFPWALARRDRGVVYDRDGIRLEVLDYYSDSRQAPVPQLKLRVNLQSPSSRAGKVPSERWQSVELAVKGGAGPHAAARPFGIGEHQALPGGERIVFWMTGDQAETEAFRDPRPEGSLGRLGQVVLHAGGKKFQFLVDNLQAQQRQPLGATGLEVELVRFSPELLSVQLQIHGGDQPPQQMLLFAGLPEFNRQDYHHRVFGDYWLDAAAQRGLDEAKQPTAEVLRSAAGPRIDILQGADLKLYCRAWRSPQVEAVVSLPADGSPVTLGENTDSPLTFCVEEFTSSDKPGSRVMPLPFEREKTTAQKQRQARLRLTVDGAAEEFWLAGIDADPQDAPLPPEQRKVVQGRNRRVALILPRDEIDVGFQIYLHNFQRKLDPGTSAASHYASLVDLVDRHDENKRLQRNVLITLNEPVNFSDPRTGRSFRLYQSSFAGPLKPGDPEFEQFAGQGAGRDQLFVSYLTVNYDPGRGLKYAGSLLIVAGMITVFYMKAHFLRKRPADYRPPDSH